MVRCGYLNQRLIAGSSLKCGDSHATPVGIAQAVNQMCELEPRTARVIPLILERWSGDISGFTPNWFIPAPLGGYGLNPKFSDKEIRYTRQQRIMAAKFIRDPKLALYKMQAPDFRLSISMFRKFTVNYRWMFGDLVLRDGEDVNVDDEWLMRLSMMQRATHQTLGGEIPEIHAIRIALRKKDLSPVSVKTLEKYWFAKLVGNHGPKCPPLNSIRYYGKIEPLYSRLERARRDFNSERVQNGLVEEFSSSFLSMLPADMQSQMVKDHADLSYSWS